jgi:hypothetical protein
MQIKGQAYANDGKVVASSAMKKRLKGEAVVRDRRHTKN